MILILFQATLFSNLNNCILYDVCGLIYIFFAEELSGIFVKSISKGSAADLTNSIQINDRIVEVSF